MVVGKLGWANPDRTTMAPFDAYGPGGRWGDDGTGYRGQTGDMLADALVREGICEGATLIVVAVPRRGDRVGIEAAVRAALDLPATPGGEG